MRGHERQGPQSPRLDHSPALRTTWTIAGVGATELGALEWGQQERGGKSDSATPWGAEGWSRLPKEGRAGTVCV